MAALLNCTPSDLDCLRSKTTEDIVNAGTRLFQFFLSTGNALIPIPQDPFNLTLEVVLVWQPTIDGFDISDQILNNVAKGKYNKVPLMIGTNNNEGTMFIYQVGRIISEFMNRLLHLSMMLNMLELLQRFGGKMHWMSWKRILRLLGT